MAVQKARSNPSPDNSRFALVPNVEIPRSTFDRSHTYKTTFDASFLIPVLVDEALPGDTFNVRMTAFARLATPLKPVMDNLYLESFFFAIPNRLLWDNWERFNGAQDDPGDSTEFLLPQVLNQGAPMPVPRGSVYDYMGIPPEIVGENFSALPIRAYKLVWNEWFRDQNLQESINVPTGNGPDPILGDELLRRGKRHDYFTSCLPFPQKGDPVQLPLAGTAPVIGFGTSPESGAIAISLNANETGNSSNPVNYPNAFAFDDPNQKWVGRVTDLGGGNFEPQIYADLGAATAATINDIRQAFQIQRLLERDARGGTRYIEIIKSHFGVTSDDARLQRPEYLGGGRSPVMINPVAQTSDQLSGGPGAETPQGNLAAFGTVNVAGHGFTKSFTEHCVILGMVAVRADLTYQQGIERQWSRRTRYDFYWPSLAHLGEQPVYNKEIYYSGAQEEDNQVFGYQERFAEYRFKPSLITGKFRSTDPQTLDIWHLAQEFEDRPVLSAEFIQDDAPIDRVIAVQDEPHFLFDAFFRMKCTRPMPLYGVPGLVDHF